MALTSITKDFVVKSGLTVQGTTNPITTATGNLGTLQVNGGGAFAKDIMVASTATIFGAANLRNALNVTGNVTVGTDKFTIDSGNGNTYADGNVDILGTLNSTGTFSVNATKFTVDGATGSVYADGNVDVLGTFNSTGSFSVNATKFTVDGATGNTHVEGNLDVTGTTFLSTLSISGALVITDPTNGGTGPVGALILENGGAYIKQDLFIDSTTAAGANAGALNLAQGGAYINKGLIVDDTANAGVGTGALVVAQGGAYIDADAIIAGTTTAGSGTGALAVTAGGAYIFGDAIIDGSTAGGVGVGALTVPQGGASISGDVYVDSTTTADDSAGGTAALRVAGGVWIGDNLIVKSTATDTSTNVSNALYIAGGAWIDKDLHVVRDATFGGNVTFNGQTTYVNSTNTVYTDNIINLHTPPGGLGDVWTVDDGKDVGFLFHYYEGGDKNAGLILDNSTHYLEWYSNGDHSDPSQFNTTTYGTFKTGSIKLVDTTASSNTGTGALTVEGGVGIGGDVWVGGTINAAQIISQGGAVIASVTTATNLRYGAAGQIPIQNGDGSTTFIAAGTANDQVLTWNNSTATWASAGSTSVGNATTASNIAGGAQYDVPFQSATGQTTFDTGLFQYNDTNKALKVNSVTVWGDNSSAPGDADVQVVADAGLGVELFSDTYSQLNYNNDGFIYVNSSGATLETVSGDYTLVLDTSGNLVLGGSVGGGYFQAPTVRADNLTSTRVVLSDANHELVDDANLTFDGTSLGLGASINISMSNGNITGVNHISATELTAATLTATTDLFLTSMTQGSALFVGANGEVSEDVGFTWSVVGSQLSATNITGAILTATTDLFLPALTTGAVTYIGANGEVSEDAGLTWSATGSQLSASNITSSVVTATSDLFLPALTTGSVPYIGADGEVSEDAGLTWSAVGSQLSASNITSSVVTATSNVYITGTDASSTSTATSGALQVKGGVGISGGLYVDQDAYVNADLYVQGTLYVQGNSLDGVDTITGSTGTFIDLVSTGTIFANKLEAATFGVNTFTAFTILTTSTLDANLSFYGYDLADVDASIKTAGGIKALGNVSVGKVLYAGMNDAGDKTGQSPAGKTIDGVFITNSMQAGGTYNSISGTSAQTIDSWSSTDYTSAKYMVQIIDSGDIHTQELMVIQDGTDVYISEYGIVTNNGELGVFDGVISGGNVLISFTPTGATAMTIQVVRQSILTSIEDYC
jgi:hypothetical protein